MGGNPGKLGQGGHGSGGRVSRRVPVSRPQPAYLCEELVTLQQLHLGLQLSDVGGRGICNTQKGAHKHLILSPAGAPPAPRPQQKEGEGFPRQLVLAASFSLGNAGP